MIQRRLATGGNSCKISSDFERKKLTRPSNNTSRPVRHASVASSGCDKTATKDLTTMEKNSKKIREIRGRLVGRKSMAENKVSVKSHSADDGDSERQLHIRSKKNDVMDVEVVDISQNEELEMGDGEFVVGSLCDSESPPSINILLHDDDTQKQLQLQAKKLTSRSKKFVGLESSVPMTEALSSKNTEQEVSVSSDEAASAHFSNDDGPSSSELFSRRAIVPSLAILSRRAQLKLFSVSDEPIAGSSTSNYKNRGEREFLVKIIRRRSAKNNDYRDTSPPAHLTEGVRVVSDNQCGSIGEKLEFSPTIPVIFS